MYKRLCKPETADEEYGGNADVHAGEPLNCLALYLSPADVRIADANQKSILRFVILPVNAFTVLLLFFHSIKGMQKVELYGIADATAARRWMSRITVWHIAR